MLNVDHTETYGRQPIGRLFEEQVLNNPDSIAVVCQGGHLTYSELNERANQLGHSLRKMGVGPEVLVGICVERSLDMVIGILGILKAGAAYVPLDPSYPQERLSFLLEDTRIALLITETRLLGKLPSYNVSTFLLDSDAEPIYPESRENLLYTVEPENLAYVIYTSGSTGRPKGVMVTHYSLSHYVHCLQKRLDISSNDVYLHTASVAFSSSIRQLMLPLSQGATVVIATSEQIANPSTLFELIRRTNVTIVDFVPSYWRNCIDTLLHLGPEARAFLLQNRLRLILSASEPLPSDVPCDWTNRFKHNARLINMFGQTETTGIVATYPIPAQDDKDIKTVPLGRAIENTEIRLLDHQMQPVPVEVPGDLYVGGTGLARGYLNRPELTADKFIPDPFGRPGGRLYKTGDRGRYLLDGTFEFLGRLDHQVKVRGYRVELGEIERALSSHPAVRNNVVVLREDVPGEKRLVAYIVPKRTGSSTVSDLRRTLKEKLPAYMVPASFVLLNQLPLTPTGKVDRMALPAPERGRRGLEGVFELPRSPVEQEVARIWCEILNLEEISVHDNFLDVGGQSLLATRIISRLQKVFQTELTVRNLFENPTVAGLSSLVEKEGRAEVKTIAPMLRPASREGQLLPSFSQLRLWFLEQLEPNSSVYIIPEVWLLNGPLNIAALDKSFNEVVRRHEVLRTTFAMEDEQVVQVISPAETTTIELTDISSLSEPEQTDQKLRLVREEAGRSFDMAEGPLVRCSLLRLSSETHLLLVTTHHIVSDAWSSRIFMRELSQLYEAFSAGRPSPLPDLPVQYADFAQWQRNCLEGDVMERHLSYWKRQLDGMSAVLNLSLDRPRPAIQTFRGATQSFVIPKAVSEGLAALGQRENVTIFMTLLAAFQVLLHRYTGQEDIAVGSPIAGRSCTEVESLIGFFVNTLVLRTDLSGNPTIHELLGRVREVALGAFDHQELPFERLVEEMRPERVTSQTPLFQVMLVLEDTPAKPISLSDLTFTPLKHDAETVKFDLVLYMTHSGSELTGSLAYNRDLFDAETIKRMVGHFQTLLEGIVADPDRRLSTLPLLTAAEEQQQLVAWNETSLDYKRKCVYELFEEQVSRTPARVAVVYDDQQLTYEELNARSNQLARHLRSLGVGPETVVGIYIERSLEMVIGLLSVLKAGGAYMPLDPGLPKERLAFMLEDAGIQVLITIAGLSKELPSHHAKVVALDADWEIISAESVENVDVGATVENLAYVIYTSGSTGRPKGTMNTHGGLCNRLLWMQAQYQLTEADRVLQKTPYSFDVSVWEFFWPLISGARLIMARPGGHQDPGYLVDLIQKEQITTLHFVPSMMQAFVEEKGVEQCATVRQVISSGEALTSELQERFFGRLNCKLHNLYGPTEASIDVTAFECERGRAASTVPIGRPIANTQIYILDESLQPVPIGVPGELHIGGKGLGRGYLHRPDLTAEKFVPDPYAVGQRLYKTGDIARYHTDGHIEYLGRLDNQVKIRGFRIELGEIETVLSQYPRVRASAVVMLRQPSGDDRLVAYVVSEDANLNSKKLREYLRTKLPEYMVPTVIVELEELPLTANGKVDRRALPAPQLSRSDLETQYEAPRTATEEVLVSIWSEILNVDAIGIYDNFFQLGGHSLLATQVISRVRERFNIQFPLRRLFEFPTVAELADAVAQAQREGKAHSELKIKPRLRDQSTLLENLGNLSAEQIDSLLSEALSKSNANK